MQKIITVKFPIANIFNQAARGLAVTAISGYQKFLSPHKGFACAHRVLYGCESCSQYFKRVITEEGIFTAIANAKGRFQECRAANEMIKKRRAKGTYYASRAIANLAAIESGDLESPDLPEESESPNPKHLGGSQWEQKQRSSANSSNNSGNSNNCADCGDGLNAISNGCLGDRNCENPLEGAECPSLSCESTDCLSGMDCSSLDCGSLDCGGADCGSCG